MAVLLCVASCAKEPNLRVVTFEATIDHDGRTQPIASETFHLLKGNLIDLLGGNSKDPNGASRLSDVTGMLSENSNPEGRARMNQVFQNHAIALVKTDAQGKAKFAAVLPGTFYIFGRTRVGENQLMIWNYPVELKEDQKGEQHVVLNSQNAATTVSYIPPPRR